MSTRFTPSRFGLGLGTLAMALAASQAGATTYSVPLQFHISLRAPVCSLTLSSTTADATTPIQSTGPSVNLTPSPIVLNSPNAIVGALPNTTTITATSPGVNTASAFAEKRLLAAGSTPTGSVTCEAGTPVTLRLSKPLGAAIAGNYMAGVNAAQPSLTLPIHMLMGIASFAGINGVVGAGGTTTGTTEPTVSATATGAAQAFALTAAIHANSSTVLDSSYAGLWTYTFNVNLDF